MNEPRQFDADMLLAAADWWTRLRDPHAAEATVEQWLEWTAQDERHLAAFEYVSAFGERLGTLDAATRSQLVDEFAPAAVPHRRRWLPLAAAAALAACVLAVGGAAWWQRAGAMNPSRVYASPVGQNRDIVLADGSKVALGGASRISVEYGHAERRVRLEAGEAYFQIMHDADRPFEVDAGAIMVRDLGTAFDVRRTGQRVAVVVTQGQVRVAERGGSVATGNGVDVAIGQRVIWNPTARAFHRDTASAEQATGWRSDRLEFVDEPLDVVIANVNRYSRKPLRLDGAGLGALSFTGTVRIDDLDGWLRALPQVFPLRVDVGAHAVTLSAHGQPPR